MKKFVKEKDVPITEMEVFEEVAAEIHEDNSEEFGLDSSITKILQHPTVASKSFLINNW